MIEGEARISADRFQSMKSDDLMAIWREGDAEKYSDKEFETIHSVLQERGFHIEGRKAKLSGLVGWLIIPRILLLPFSIIMALGLLIVGIVGLVDSSSSDAGMIWALPFGIIFSVISLTAAYFFYNEHKKAPMAMIIMLVLFVGFPLVAGIYGILAVETFRPFAWLIMMSIIGIPSICYIFYFLKSERVRRTFIKGK